MRATVVSIDAKTATVRLTPSWLGRLFGGRVVEVARADHDQRGRHEDSLNARTTELEVIAGPEPETGVEVEILTSHEINADCHSLGCIEDGAAHDPDEDDEPATRVRSDDPAPVESEIGGEA